MTELSIVLNLTPASVKRAALDSLTLPTPFAMVDLLKELGLSDSASNRKFVGLCLRKSGFYSERRRINGRQIHAWYPDIADRL